MIEYKLINFCEHDKYAIKSYCLIHNEPESKNLGDITKVNEKTIADFNIMTWGFPCTDISIAGKQNGFVDKEGNKTRSGLYYDGLRILKEKKPMISIIENVKALTQNKFKMEFNKILNDLSESGYNNYNSVLNAKDYGIPQNRERVFIISIRKDIDNGNFKFPKGFDNGIRLKDLLQNIVDEKYYISQDKTNKLIEQLKNKNINKLCINTKMQELQIREDGLCCTLISSMYKEPPLVIDISKVNQCENNKILQIGMLDIKGNEQVRRVYNPFGLSPTLNTMGGGNRQPKIIEDFYANRDVREYEYYSPTLRADRQGLKVLEENNEVYPNIPPINTHYRIRKLTPLECFRLMGFSDEDFHILKENGTSDTQIYKQAGNSIVVDVLYHILIEIYKVMPYLLEDIKLASFFSGIGAFEKAIIRLQTTINNISD